MATLISHTTANIRYCKVPGCERSFFTWKHDCKGSQPFVFRTQRPAVLAQWRQALQLGSEAKNVFVCDIHFTREDFYPFCKPTNYPAYLQGLKKNPIAVPSLYLDKNKNLDAKVIAKAINEPDWWKLIVVDSSNDTNLPGNRPNEDDTEDSLHMSQPGRVTITEDNDFNTMIGSQHNQGHEYYCNPSIQTNSDINNPKPGCSATFPCNQRLPPQTAILSVNKKVPRQRKSTHEIRFTLDSIEQEQFDLEFLMQDDCSNYLDSKDEDSDIEIIEPKMEHVNKVVVKPKPPMKVNKNAKLTAEEIQDTKKKLHLFRMLSTSIIQLPSPLWAVHPNYESKNVVICKVLHTSDGFQVERGVCFDATMAWPDIRINGQKVLINPSELTCIAEIEKLIKQVDIYKSK